MQVQPHDDYPVRVVQQVEVPVSDGIHLGATLYMPDAPNDGPFPGIVEYHPYRKDDNKLARDWQVHSYLARKGYVGVCLDVRGTGASGGIAENEYTQREAHDCLDALAWLAAQTWCTGKLGMWGSSYGGITAIQAAMHAPPELHAILPMHALVDRYCEDVHYHGGCLPVNESVAWAGRMVALNALPPLPEIVGDRWREMWRARLERTPQWPFEWLRHQTRDAYWRCGSLCEDWHAIQCPVFAVGGWADSYHDFVLRMLAHLRVPRKGLIGPWLHDRPHLARPGPQIDILREMVRWWDQWLKGLDTGIMDEPMLAVWVQTSRPPAPYSLVTPGRWHYETEWPSSRTVQHTLFLRETGVLGSQSPSGARPDVWNGPLTVGTTAPFWCTGFRPSGLPRDQRPDDAHSLSFDSAPLDEPVEILGFPRVVLYVAATEAVAQLAVRLCDVAPDGASLLITRGVLNLTHRASHARPTPLDPGRIYAVEVELGSIAHEFAAGHRVRLCVAGADWPLVWPVPRPFSLFVYHDADNPARLCLPVVPPQRPDARVPHFAPPIVPTAPVRHQAGPGTFTVERNAATGTTRVCTAFASSSYLEPRGLTLTETSQKTLSLREADPLSCRAALRRRLGLERPGWRIGVESELLLSCSETTYVVEIGLEARHNAELVFARRWREEFPRFLG